LKVNRRFGAKEVVEQETSVKAGGKQSNCLAEISDYIKKRREVEDSKSVPIGLPIGRNELQVPIGFQKQARYSIPVTYWFAQSCLRTNGYGRFVISCEWATGTHFLSSISLLFPV
jgi:hypothetical protein